MEPDILLPAQWSQNLPPDSSSIPERRLLLAILEEGVATYQRHVLDVQRRGRRLFLEAEAWLLSDDLSWPCSFRNLCDRLSIEPEYLRRGLREWSARRRADPARPAPHRHAFRRLSGSRTRAVGRPIGEGRHPRRATAVAAR